MDTLPEAPRSSCDKVMKITLMGTAFIGIGAVLTTHVPAFHKPVEWIDRHLRSSIDQCARLPKVGHFFASNPLLQNKDVTEFLSLNVFETMLTMTLVAAAGGVLGISRGQKHLSAATANMHSR